MPKVVLSYRRADPLPEWQVKPIGRMCRECGFDEVFVDRDKGAIPHGSDNRAEIEKAVGASDVVLVLIGEKWQGLLDVKRNDSNDMVRLEIRLGLELGKRVVPILLGGKMPAESDLPEEIRKFHFKNGQAFDSETMHTEMPPFLRNLARADAERLGRESAERKKREAREAGVKPVKTPLPPPIPMRSSGGIGRWMFVVLALVAAGFAAAFWRPGQHDRFYQSDRSDVSPGTDRAVPSPQPSTKSPQPGLGPFPNTLGMKFVPVPGTDILMCIWETRIQDYAEYAAAANPAVDTQWKDVGESGPDHPVVNVSWEDAQGFCKWLSAREGRTYRLPTDHEWSLAVGIGDRESATASPADKDGKIPDVYPWGTLWPPPEGAGNYGSSTVPVGGSNANRLGIHDLGGNVWEWCEDYYSGNSGSRVLRGASWDDRGVSTDLLSSYRVSNPLRRGGDYGFRVVVDVGSGER